MKELLAQGVLADSTVEFVRHLSSRTSELFEYRVRSGIQTKMIIAKRHLSGSDAEQRTLQEFANLDKVRTALGDTGRDSVPEPILVLPQEVLLLTEKVPGTPFSLILQRNANSVVGSFRSSLIYEAGQCIGRWLRHFQHATQSEPVIFQSDLFLTDLERHISRCRKRGLGADVALDILHRASAQAARLNGKLVPAAGSHGDFIPQNIIVHHNRVAVVDFEGFRERQPVYDDIGMFLAYLAALTTRFRYSRNSLHAGAKGFLNGLAMGRSLDRDLISIHILKGTVRILAVRALRKGIWNRWISLRMLKWLRQSDPFAL